jgi:glutaredoxin
MEVPKNGWTLISKINCMNCDMAVEILEDNFIEFQKIMINDMNDFFVKPKECKTYPIIYENGIYFGAIGDLRRKFQ